MASAIMDTLKHEVERAAATLSVARRLVKERRIRARMLPDIEFGEPAWDVLLDLYVAHHEGKLVSVSSLCIASGVPASTALRWIWLMEERGQLQRHKDPAHRRRMFMSLSDETLTAMDRYLAELIPA